MGYRFKMWMRMIVQSLLNQGFLNFILISSFILPLHRADKGGSENLQRRFER